jgi:hypothetical protein
MRRSMAYPYKISLHFIILQPQNVMLRPQQGPYVPLTRRGTSTVHAVVIR